MGHNEILLLGTGFLSLGLVLAAWRFDKERLYSAILVFLILITVIVGKIVPFFGHETNTGNIFYASVFLATYLLIERYGKREGMRSIWIGIIGVGIFSTFLQMAAALTAAQDSAQLSHALTMVFAVVPRISFASLLSYAISQSCNVYLYVSLKKHFAERGLWLRINACNILAQTLDSLVFFTVAFWCTVLPAHLFDIVLTGFIIKVVFVMLTSPLLYLNRTQLEHEGEYATLTLR